MSKKKKDEEKRCSVCGCAVESSADGGGGIVLTSYDENKRAAPLAYFCGLECMRKWAFDE